MKFVPERFLLAERASNFKRLVLDGFVAEFSRSPPSITGMLRKPRCEFRRAVRLGEDQPAVPGGSLQRAEPHELQYLREHPIRQQPVRQDQQRAGSPDHAIGAEADFLEELGAKSGLMTSAIS